MEALFNNNNHLDHEEKNDLVSVENIHNKVYSEIENKLRNTEIIGYY